MVQIKVTKGDLKEEINKDQVISEKLVLSHKHFLALPLKSEKVQDEQNSLMS